MTTFSMTPILDYKISLENAAGDESLAKELFGMLLAELPKLKQDLQDALTSKDKTACWDHAHKLYGSTAYTGVPRLKEIAQKMEAAVKQDDEEMMTATFTKLATEVDSILEIGAHELKQNWDGSA
ncbi:hypothetical protein MNBD_GAMMA21-2892 [hydrothermal vent metagenome]|uniref:HPt domain-containing protein n=1 Tax=hydrothermal vent metagenome TaxID=652676 RepID=A0A3B1AMG2_9ZZZZ